jgi:NADH-dependent peroxiredoxin subunit F
MVSFSAYTPKITVAKSMFDLIIIGGGPGGVSAGIYAARKQLKTLFITKEWGGQSVVSPGIENWIGTINISGADLAKSLETHLKHYAKDTVTIKEGVLVTKVEKSGDGFKVILDNGETAEARAVLITSGSKRRTLDVPGAKEFDQKGLTYCASCDGPLFAGQDVVVIGGGNAGFETAAQLLAYTKSVTLLNRSGELRADPVTVEKVTKNEKMKLVMNAIPTEVIGEKFVKAIKYKDAVSGAETELPVGGIFVEIGLIPSTEYVADVVALDDYKRIKIDPRTQQTSVPGIWAAGDCTDILYHQNNISVGDSVRALEDIYVHLHTK